MLATGFTEVQDGAVGSTVSNGVWASTGFTAPSCSAGSTSEAWHYTWRVVAEDFQGSRVTGHSISASWELN